MHCVMSLLQPLQVLRQLTDRPTAAGQAPTLSLTASPTVAAAPERTLGWMKHCSDLEEHVFCSYSTVN